MQRGQKIPGGSLDAGRKPAKQQKTHQGLSIQMQERSWKRNPGYSWPFVSEVLQQNSSLTHACENAIVLVGGVYLKYELWKLETRQQNLAVHITRLSCHWREGQNEAPCSGICIKLTVVWKLQSPKGSRPSPWGQARKELNFHKVPKLWQGAKKIENDFVCLSIAGSFQSSRHSFDQK